MEDLNLFNKMDLLEPKCPECGNKIEYGVTTTWNAKNEAHSCNGCGSILK